MNKTLIVSLAALALIGCGKGRTNNPFHAVAVANSAPELQGTYESKCETGRQSFVDSLKALFNSASDVYPQSERKQIVFQGDAATIKEIHYLGKDCDGGEAYAFVEKGSFKVGDKDKNEMNNAGRHLDIEMNAVEAKILSPDGERFANAYALCDKKNWKADDAATDVTTSSEQDNCYGVPAKRSIANVYQVDRNILALGYTGPQALASEERPVSIDHSNIFQRK